MDTRTRERLGAATGIVTAVLLGASFLIGLSPTPPGMDASGIAVSAYLVDNTNAIRVEILLNSVAFLFFLWFLGSVRAGLRGAEGGSGRVSAIASGGGLVGTGFVLLAQVFTAAATLRPEAIDPVIARTLIDLQALSIGIGAAAFAVFFIAICVAVFFDGGLPKWLGGLAGLAGLVAVVGLVTHFSDSGLFAADGAFGFWARYGAFTIWVLVASIVMVVSPPTRRARRRAS